MAVGVPRDASALPQVWPLHPSPRLLRGHGGRYEVLQVSGSPRHRQRCACADGTATPADLQDTEGPCPSHGLVGHISPSHLSRDPGESLTRTNMGPIRMSSSSRNRLIDISGVILFDTEKAYRFDGGTGEPVWLPKSQCEWDKDAKEMTMPEWLAKEKG